MFFLTLNHQCQSTEGTKSTHADQWPGLVLSSFTTRLMTELVLHFWAAVY